MEEISAVLESTLGLGEERLSIAEMVLRGVVVYLAMVLVVRLGKKRFMGAATAFDVILGIMIGSIASRAITGNAPFFAALVAAASLMLMHWVFSAIAVRWHGFGVLIKGHPRLVIKDGRIDQHAAHRAHLTEGDLWEALRGRGVSSLDEVAEAHLERNGSISVLRARSEPKVVEVAVANGVQTVRVEWR